ncbi:MAG: hypothetical protein CME06_02760 [Gemmatimonadetes bacterium]|nr:hypothetical protein [Gemmatimonadota bacterium]
MKGRIVARLVSENLADSRSTRSRRSFGAPFQALRNSHPHLPARRIAAAVVAAAVLFVGGRGVLRFGSATAREDGSTPGSRYVTAPVHALPTGNSTSQNPSSSSPSPLHAASSFLDDGDRLPLAELFHLGVRHVVIDPGHGGRDPGTAGPNTGLLEKGVTLDICLKLASILEADPRLSVTLTRSSDVGLGLRERARIANRSGGDLFVSVHINSFENPEFRGIETFHLGFPTDDRAEKAAARENLGGEGRIGEFEELIAKMGETLKEEESGLLARSIQKRLYRGLLDVRGRRIRDYGVRRAPFLVLLDTRMPSVLAEVSLMNDPEEERRLTRQSHRHEIARLLSEGIQDYIEGLSRRGLVAAE